MNYREAALEKIEQISAESKRKQIEMEAPRRAIELLFGVTQTQMREAILKAREAGNMDTKQLTLPPFLKLHEDTDESRAAVELLFGVEPREHTQLGGTGMVMSYRGHKLVVGEKLEAV